MLWRQLVSSLCCSLLFLSLCHSHHTLVMKSNPLTVLLTWGQLLLDVTTSPTVRNKKKKVFQQTLACTAYKNSHFERFVYFLLISYICYCFFEWTKYCNLTFFLTFPFLIVDVVSHFAFYCGIL